MPRRLHAPAVALGVGALLGLVVAGGGSRLAMRLVAIADDRQDFGRLTAGGDVVGDVTAEGTLFVLFAGLALGVVGALGYLAIRRWLPERPLLRGLAFAVLILGIGMRMTVNGNAEDFEFVNVTLSVLSFAIVLAAYGLLVPVTVDRLSPPTTSRWRVGRGAAAVVLLASVVLGALAVRHAYEIADGGLALV